MPKIQENIFSQSDIFQQKLAQYFITKSINSLIYDLKYFEESIKYCDKENLFNLISIIEELKRKISLVINTVS